MVCRVPALQRSLVETPFHQLVIAVLPNGVCRAAGPQLGRVAHPLGVVEPVSTLTRQAVTNTLPALFPDCLLLLGCGGPSWRGCNWVTG